MDIHLLVCWIDDNPKNFSVMTRNDIIDGNLRGLPSSKLVGQTVDIKFNRKSCRAEILSIGSRKELKQKLDAEIAGALTTGNISPQSIGKDVPSPEVSSGHYQALKKSRIDTTLASIEDESVLRQDDQRDARIAELELDLAREKLQNQQLKDELNKTRVLYENLLATGSQDVDIGNGILVKKETISTLKTVSSTTNMFGRNLFRHLFGAHEVVGRSLMGKRCNASRNSEHQPSVDSLKRDAVIEYTLTAFGWNPGSDNYKLALKDLKHSLANLIQEINKDAKSVEESILNAINTTEGN